jgi:catechol 2,3-dioxygenase-like lactoylglutathione lyase family enzyme
MTIDHVAIPTPDIAGSVRWYVQQFSAEVLYEDATWAFLKFGNCKLALVTPGQHPPHVAISVTLPELEERARLVGKSVDVHRDGTRGVYISDPAGNAVELIHYPAGQTHYGRKV